MEEVIYLAAGCFWGVQERLRKLEGVKETEVGYMGGHSENPTYEDVCYSDTNHAESVKVVYDSAVISTEALLKKFWEIHDPTTMNRQGPDIGTQYRSGIFTTTEEQSQIAEKSKTENQAFFTSPIVTKIEKADTFYKAEEYHQMYIAKKNSE